ncbi:MAG: acetyl-CoA acetyltransferase [Myxococcales bacterium]|nr:acetyl-CoA acetyltransferase [Myxococcales bacterium]
MPNAVIVDALRTPIGRFRGALSGVRPDDLAGHVIGELVKRNAVPADEIDDVVFGCANQAGEDNRNVARMGLLLAGLPQGVPGLTVNRLCGSGLEAILTCARSIRAGEGDLFVAGGVESMSRAPFAMPKSASPWPNGNVTVFDTSLGWRFPNDKMKKLFPLEAMGETAENLVERFAIGRAEQDQFALESHQKAVAAQAAGRFADEIVAVEAAGAKKGERVQVVSDEGPRGDTTLEKLARLEPAFRPGGSVTAGNSSTLNDGAGALLVCSEERAKKQGWKPLARVVAGASAGVDPRYMGIGPVPATLKALARAGWSPSEIGLAELNEAFAAQVLACLRELPIGRDRVNVNGGAIALGHPLGCSGARLAGTLIYEMRRRGTPRGLATMCIGVGQGIAALFELV